MSDTTYHRPYPGDMASMLFMPHPLDNVYSYSNSTVSGVMAVNGLSLRA